MIFRRLGYYIGKGFKSIGRNKIMSISTIVTVAISLFVMGAFLVALANVNTFIESQGNKTQLAVYVSPEFTTEEAKQVKEELLDIEGVDEITYISKDDAKAMMMKKFGGEKEWKEIFGDENPYPHTFNITAKDSTQLDGISVAAAKIEGVYKVNYPKDLVQQLITASNNFSIIGMVVIVILFLSATFLISTTIKLSVYAKRKELMVMKYVGSSNGFIQGPFIISGMLLGFLGALLASGILFVAYKLIMDKWAASIAFLDLQFNVMEISVIIGILFASGLLIGFIGSYVATRKYIKV